MVKSELGMVPEDWTVQNWEMYLSFKMVMPFTKTAIVKKGNLSSI